MNRITEKINGIDLNIEEQQCDNLSNQYDPKNFFSKSYNHNFESSQQNQNDSSQNNQELEEKNILYQQPEQNYFQVPLKIKKDRIQKQEIISFADQQFESGELQNQNQERLNNFYQDERPIKPLENEEYYSINKIIEDKERKNKSVDYLRKKQNELLPCNIIKKNEKENYYQSKQNQNINLQIQLKEIQKYVQSNLHQTNNIKEQQYEPEKELIAKQYLSQQLEYLQNQIKYYETENDKLRKQQLDFNQHVKNLEETQRQWELQKNIEKKQLDELKSIEQQKINQRRRLNKIAQKMQQDQPNQKNITIIQQQQKEIDNLIKEKQEGNEKLEHKNNKYLKFCKDMKLTIQSLEKELIQKNEQIKQLETQLIFYTENKEIQDIIIKQQNEKKQIELKENEIKNDKIKQEPQTQQIKVEEAPKIIKLFDFIQDQEAILDLCHIQKNILPIEFKYDYNEYYQHYLKLSKQKKQKPIQTIQKDDGKILKVYKSGKKEIQGQNGFLKEIFQNDYVIIHFQNKDILQELPNGVKIYYFNQTKSTQTTLPKGINVLYFENHQIEITYVDGTKKILFPDGTKKIIHYNGDEEIFYIDGTIKQKKNPLQSKVELLQQNNDIQN